MQFKQISCINLYEALTVLSNDLENDNDFNGAHKIDIFNEKLLGNFGHKYIPNNFIFKYIGNLEAFIYSLELHSYSKVLANMKAHPSIYMRNTPRHEARGLVAFENMTKHVGYDKDKHLIIAPYNKKAVELYGDPELDLHV